MIVLTVECNVPSIEVTNTDGPGLPVVRAPGFLTHSQMDSLLSEVGAGRFEGHYAEVSSSWLRNKLGVTPDGFTEWMKEPAAAGLVDDSGEWVMAPIDWDEEWAPLALPPSSVART